MIGIKASPRFQIFRREVLARASAPASSTSEFDMLSIFSDRHPHEASASARLLVAGQSLQSGTEDIHELVQGIGEPLTTGVV